MSSVVIGIIVAIVILIAIVFALKKKAPELPADKERPEKAALAPAKPEPKKEEKDRHEAKSSAETSATEAKDESPDRSTAAEGAAGEPPEKQKTKPSPPPGVRLDDKAEDKAVAELEYARKERKLKRLRQGLAPTRSGFITALGKLFKGKKEIDPELLSDLEDTLLTSDVGTKTAQKLLDSVKDALEKNELSDPDAVQDLLREAISQILSIEAKPIDVNSEKPFVIMVVGVNGVGKTTTIGKLATQFADNGHKIVLAAGDTFRAAAVNQLTIWGRRSNAEVVKSKEGADPSSVIFDAIKRAKEIGADIVIADTAGRLHTKQPLMEELKKIGRVMGKAHEGAPHETLLVLDATTGQNAIQQVSMFKEVMDVSGLVLTKLDGTAKGGVIIGICHEHAIPVRYIGIGESKDDLREFNVSDFVDALFALGNK